MRRKGNNTQIIKKGDVSITVCVSDIRVHHHFKYAIYFYKNDKYTNICSTILKYHCIVIKGMLKIARVISGKIQFNSIMNF